MKQNRLIFSVGALMLSAAIFSSGTWAFEGDGVLLDLQGGSIAGWNVPVKPTAGTQDGSASPQAGGMVEGHFKGSWDDFATFVGGVGGRFVGAAGGVGQTYSADAEFGLAGRGHNRGYVALKAAIDSMKTGSGQNNLDLLKGQGEKGFTGVLLGLAAGKQLGDETDKNLVYVEAIGGAGITHLQKGCDVGVDGNCSYSSGGRNWICTQVTGGQYCRWESYGPSLQTHSTSATTPAVGIEVLGRFGEPNKRFSTTVNGRIVVYGNQAISGQGAISVNVLPLARAVVIATYYSSGKVLGPAPSNSMNADHNAKIITGMTVGFGYNGKY